MNYPQHLHLRVIALLVCIITCGCRDNDGYEAVAGQYELVFEESYSSEWTDYGMYTVSGKYPVGMDSRQMLILTNKGDAVRYEGNEKVAAFCDYGLGPGADGSSVRIYLDDGQIEFKYTDPYVYHFDTKELTRTRTYDLYRGYGYHKQVWLRTD